MALTLFCLAPHAQVTPNLNCSSANTYDAYSVPVARVNDGDTITLSDGRLVRFLGINTPEIDYKNKTSEPYAKAAKRFLQKHLEASSKVHLVYDKVRQDKYDRILAHVFTEEGHNLNAKLIAHGFARKYIIPPNLSFESCYQQLELYARNNGIGLWSHSAYKILSARAITQENLGYGLVKGQVTQYQKLKQGHVWHLDEVFSIFIANRTWQKYFTQSELPEIGSMTLVRGKIRLRNNQFTVQIFHPAHWELLDEPS